MRTAVPFVPAAALVLVLGGCGAAGDAAPEAGASGAASPEAAEAPAAGEAGAARPAGRPAASAAAARGGWSTFPHEEHGRIACESCHQRVIGHASHGGLKCGECHGAPVAEAAPVVASPDRCRSCHHAAERGSDCLACHARGSPGERRVAVLMRMSVRDDPVERALPFDHARHMERACTTCHGPPPAYAFALECGECHESHHRPASECASCHEPGAPAAHAGQAHNECAGCHEDPVVAALPASRTACLTCHSAQRDHEPAGECAACHLLRAPGPAASREGGP